MLALDSALTISLSCYSVIYGVPNLHIAMKAIRI
jgi:hypothetical protein